MTLTHVPTPQWFEMWEDSASNLMKALIEKEVYIALGDVGRDYLFISYFDSNNTYYTMSVR